ncbi:peptidylprolyl isomerase [Phormidium tenue FACHB-886]|nr:peptidylprolyl isomerase [Phormidium tenue FACHB-886]
MTTILSSAHSVVEQLRQQAIEANALLPLLATHQLIPNLLGEGIIAQAIDPIICTAEETAQACELLHQQWGLTSIEQQAEWRSRYRLSQKQIESIATRNLRLEKFIETTWGHRLESYFLQHKHNLDQVIYSLIRHRDCDLLNELYFRIVEGEQTFAELANEYSQGQEAETGGRLGPFEMASLNPNLAKLLYYAPIDEVQSPQQFDNYYAIVRVEQRLPAQLDDQMRHRLLQQQFDRWFQEQLRQLPEADQRWMGIVPDLDSAALQAA